MRRYVREFADKKTRDKNQMARFTESYLGADGVFLLRLIDENTDDVTTHDVAEALWEKYTAPNKTDPTAPPIDESTV